MSGLICWCGDGLHVENETPFCDSCGTVYSCIEQAKVASAKTIERYNLFLQSMTDELKLTNQAETIAALEREVERLKEVKRNALELCKAVENEEDFGPTKYAVRCMRLIIKIRELTDKALAGGEAGK